MKVWVVGSEFGGQDYFVDAVCATAALAEQLRRRVPEELLPWVEEKDIPESLATPMSAVERNRLRRGCTDCMAVDGRYICTMNCGPAVKMPEAWIPK